MRRITSLAVDISRPEDDFVIIGRFRQDILEIIQREGATNEAH
jgi:hypothetical protein